MRERSRIVVLAGLVVVTLIVSVYRTTSRLERAPAGRNVSADLDWRRITSSSKTIGPAGATVAIIAFSDYECPACKGSNEALRRLRDEFPAELAVTFAHFPISRLHRHALPAAIASECAADQGAFGPYHDYLFEHQDSFGVLAWNTIAAAAGVSDLDAFEVCMISQGARNGVEGDVAIARDLRITGTPAFIVNGILFDDNLSYRSLRMLIRRNLREL